MCRLAHLWKQHTSSRMCSRTHVLTHAQPKGHTLSLVCEGVRTHACSFVCPRAHMHVCSCRRAHTHASTHRPAQLHERMHTQEFMVRLSLAHRRAYAQARTRTAGAHACVGARMSKCARLYIYAQSGNTHARTPSHKLASALMQTRAQARTSRQHARTYAQQCRSAHTYPLAHTLSQVRARTYATLAQVSVRAHRRLPYPHIRVRQHSRAGTHTLRAGTHTHTRWHACSRKCAHARTHSRTRRKHKCAGAQARTCRCAHMHPSLRRRSRTHRHAHLITQVLTHARLREHERRRGRTHAYMLCYHLLNFFFPSVPLSILILIQQVPYFCICISLIFFDRIQLET